MEGMIMFQKTHKVHFRLHQFQVLHNIIGQFIQIAIIVVVQQIVTV